MSPKSLHKKNINRIFKETAIPEKKKPRKNSAIPAVNATESSLVPNSDQVAEKNLTEFMRDDSEDEE